MLELWIPISDVSAAGREYTFDDQALWHEGWKAFSLDVKPGKDLVAEVFVMQQGDDGALVRGTLKGSVTLPCDRCAIGFEFAIDESFDTYEQLPDGEYDEAPRVRQVNGELQLDIGAILWEEFVVALPVKPLCDDSCKGVCPGCGKDLNTESCECDTDEGDERLAVFRNLKIK